MYQTQSARSISSDIKTFGGGGCRNGLLGKEHATWQQNLCSHPQNAHKNLAGTEDTDGIPGSLASLSSQTDEIHIQGKTLPQN